MARSFTNCHRQQRDLRLDQAMFWSVLLGDSSINWPNYKELICMMLDFPVGFALLQMLKGVLAY